MPSLPDAPVFATLEADGGQIVEVLQGSWTEAARWIETANKYGRPPNAVKPSATDLQVMVARKLSDSRMLFQPSLPPWIPERAYRGMWQPVTVFIHH